MSQYHSAPSEKELQGVTNTRPTDETDGQTDAKAIAKKRKHSAVARKNAIKSDPRQTSWYLDSQKQHSLRKRMKRKEAGRQRSADYFHNAFCESICELLSANFEIIEKKLMSRSLAFMILTINIKRNTSPKRFVNNYFD